MAKFIVYGLRLKILLIKERGSGKEKDGVVLQCDAQRLADERSLTAQTKIQILAVSVYYYLWVRSDMINDNLGKRKFTVKNQR